MQKTCEFCVALRPAVYCKADAAYLCLSCDAKVHSANALSNRHIRILLCNSCTNHPAYARCLDHQLFMCQDCDQALHGVSAQHQKEAVSSYMGCPSAKDFAALWGFELNELNQNGPLQPGVTKFDIPGESCPAIDDSSPNCKVSCSTAFSGAGSDIGSSCLKREMPYKGDQVENNSFILQQILDLKKLQLKEADDISSVTYSEEKGAFSTLICNTLKELDNSIDPLQHSQDLGKHLQQSDSVLRELEVDSMLLPFSHVEQLPLSSSAANPVLGESFWQCKRPAQSNQELWSQNIQDLGVCEDIVCQEDVNIPDVDVTFRNFEELFGDQDPIRVLLDAEDMLNISIERYTSLKKSHNGNEGTSKSFQLKKNEVLSNKIPDILDSTKSPRTMQPYYSNMSFTFSRLSAESSGTEYLDSGPSPNTTQGEVSCYSPDLESAHAEARGNAIMRYKEKKKARLKEKKQHYSSRKAKSDVQK